MKHSELYLEADGAQGGSGDANSWQSDAAWRLDGGGNDSATSSGESSGRAGNDERFITDSSWDTGAGGNGFDSGSGGADASLFGGGAPGMDGSGSSAGAGGSRGRDTGVGGSGQAMSAGGASGTGAGAIGGSGTGDSGGGATGTGGIAVGGNGNGGSGVGGSGVGGASGAVACADDAACTGPASCCDAYGCVLLSGAQVCRKKCEKHSDCATGCCALAPTSTVSTCLDFSYCGRASCKMLREECALADQCCSGLVCEGSYSPVGHCYRLNCMSDWECPPGNSCKLADAGPGPGTCVLTSSK